VIISHVLPAAVTSFGQILEASAVPGEILEEEEFVVR
jgi:hypothetical protein